MIAIIAALVLAAAIAVLLVIVTIGIHRDERRAAIRNRPRGRLAVAVRRVIGPYVRDLERTESTGQEARERKEARV
jgi:hypothetical protein